jgi:hypothetical protein
MTRENRCPGMVFGYLSAVESAEHGFFGGYLLISPNGRPLEFHCTAPVRPSRAQQILYGPTLSPYLLGEQIGGTLIREAAFKPAIVLTDQTAVLCLRSQIDIPLVHIEHNVDVDDEVNAGRAGASIGDLGHNRVVAPPFALAGSLVRVATGFDADGKEAIRLLTELAQHVELDEPFGRIHDAIGEAQRISRGSHEIHGQAA